MLNSVFQHNLMRLDLLLKNMGFHLVDCRRNLDKLTKVNQTIRIEIADSYRTGFAFPVCFFHGSIGSVIIIKRLVDQQKINIVCLQLA